MKPADFKNDLQAVHHVKQIQFAKKPGDTSNGELDVSITATISNENRTKYEHKGRDTDETIVVHTEECVDFSLAPNRSIPLLWMHRTAAPIGRVTNLRLENKSLVGDLKFAPTQHAQEVQDLVLAGVCQFCSIGYTVDPDHIEIQNEVRYIKKWRPYELSIVAVPRNPTTGLHVSEIPNAMRGREYEARKRREIETLRYKLRETEIDMAAHLSGRQIKEEVINQAIAQGWSLEQFCTICEIPKDILETGGNHHA